MIGHNLFSSTIPNTHSRKYWTQLSTVIRGTSRVIWWSIPEIPPPPEKIEYTDAERADRVKVELLTKATAVRILVGFAYALKRHLRGQFGTDWDDLRDLVGFLPTVSDSTPEYQAAVTKRITLPASTGVCDLSSRRSIPCIHRGEGPARP